MPPLRDRRSARIANTAAHSRRRCVVGFEPGAACDAVVAAAAAMGGHSCLSRCDAGRYAGRARRIARRRTLFLRACPLPRGHAYRSAADDAADAGAAIAAGVPGGRARKAADAGQHGRSPICRRPDAAGVDAGGRRDAVRVRQRKVEPSRDAGAVRHGPLLRDQCAVPCVRRGRRLCAARVLVGGRLAVAASAARCASGLLAPGRERLAPRRFDRWLPLAEAEPAIHVNAFEAEASAHGPAGACPRRPNGNPRPWRPQWPPTPISITAAPVPVAWTAPERASRIFSATSGNGRPRRSNLIRDSRRIPTPTIRRPGSATIVCYTAVVCDALAPRPCALAQFLPAGAV